MSDLEHRLYFQLGNMDKRVFGIQDICSILDIKEGHARKIAYGLVEKQIIIRVKPGTFTRIPESVILKKGEYGEDHILIASELADNYFISHFTALSFHELADRFSNTVFVSSPTNQRSVSLKNGTIRFIRIKPERYFGFESRKYYDGSINVSDLERTIFDIVERPSLSGGWIEVILILKNLEGLDEDRLISYMERLKNRKATRTLAYFLNEIGSVDISPDAIKCMKEISGPNKYYIERKMGGSLVSDWNLIVPDRMRRALHFDWG